MKHIVIILCGVLSLPFMAGQLFAQERPSWLNGYFKDLHNSYVEVVSAVGRTEDSAREKAAKIIVERRSGATGLRSNISISNGIIHVDGSDDLTVKFRIIDQYTEQLRPGDYRVSLLVQTAKNPGYQYEPVSVTNNYEFSPRVFVPGMAQIYKGQTSRGVIFIAGEVIAVGGIVAFEGVRSSYESKIKRTHNPNEIQTYVNKADNMRNIRNGFIAGAVAIYAWNVIDGIVAKGNKHVSVGRMNMTFAPYADPMSQGMLVCLTF